MRVLVPYNGSELSEKVVEHAVERYDDAEIVLIRVLDFVGAGYEAPPEAALPGYWADWYGEAEESAGTMFGEVTDAYGATFATEAVVR